jgi:hypothetical protein
LHDDELTALPSLTIRPNEARFVVRRIFDDLGKE